MKVEEKAVNIGAKKISYTHIQNNSTKVCFMFSGAGYTYDQPLFYYSTMAMLEDQIDIVHIHYRYTPDELALPLTTIAEMVIRDVNPVIAEVLQGHEYKEQIFLGKSLGTLPIIHQLLDEFESSKCILLTPLLKYVAVLESLLASKRSALIILGKKDHHYFTDKVEALRSQQNYLIKEFEKANHSLEVEPFQTFDSISVMSDTIRAIRHYIK